MGATQVSNIGLPQEVNFNDLFMSDISTDGTLNTNATTGATGFNVASLPNLQSKIDATSKGWGLADMFNFGGKTGSDDKKGSDGGSFGSTLEGIGAVTGALASIYGIHEQKEYQNEVLGMEKDRVAKNEARRDAKQAEYDKVWG